MNQWVKRNHDLLSGSRQNDFPVAEGTSEVEFKSEGERFDKSFASGSQKRRIISQLRPIIVMPFKNDFEQCNHNVSISSYCYGAATGR
jgi:hypothetical protein